MVIQDLIKKKKKNMCLGTKPTRVTVNDICTIFIIFEKLLQAPTYQFFLILPSKNKKQKENLH
jgi:hypothetical protein